ncbi:MAG: hypothetical protein IPJ86_17745 [Bacteroidetes bacterium]|nr:hypothetical protein [Bacteroidota bacterium]
MGFATAAPINFIDIYETYSTGSVDTVYVKNPYTGVFQPVYNRTAGSLPDRINQLHIEFPMTAFPVSEVRVALNSPAVFDWNEIDAIAIGVIDTNTYDTYAWSTGETTPTISVDTLGTFDVTVSENGCSGTSNQVNTYLQEVAAGPSFNWITCQDTITFNASPGFSSYQWSTGDLTQGITVSPGVQTTYTVTVTDNFGCNYSMMLPYSFHLHLI